MICRGQFEVAVDAKNHEGYQLKICVADSDTDNLLGRSAASSLGLVQRLVDNVHVSAFGDLDDQPVECTPVKIRLKDNAEPFSFTTARRIPIPIMDKIKVELERMKRANIVEEMAEPADWCAPIVAVLKKSGAVWICTDLKRLNEAVKRDRYMIPTIEDTLHKLNGARIFSKLDATLGSVSYTHLRAHET